MKNKRKLAPRRIIRVIAGLMLAMAIVILAFGRTISPEPAPVLSTVLMSVGGLIFVATILRLVFKRQAKLSDDFEQINRRFSNIMRQINTINRNVPKMQGKIDAGADAGEQKTSMIEILAETEALNMSGIDEQYAELVAKLRQYVQECLGIMRAAGESPGDVKAALAEVGNKTREFFPLAMNERVAFLDRYDRRR